MTFMKHIQIDQKLILNPIWANTYHAKEKKIGKGKERKGKELYLSV